MPTSPALGTLTSAQAGQPGWGTSREEQWLQKGCFWNCPRCWSKRRSRTFQPTSAVAAGPRPQSTEHVRRGHWPPVARRLPRGTSLRGPVPMRAGSQHPKSQWGGVPRRHSRGCVAPGNGALPEPGPPLASPMRCSGGERLSPLGVARVTVPLPGGTFGTRAGLVPAGSPVQRGLGRLLKIRQTSSETFQNHSFTRTAPQAEWPQGQGPAIRPSVRNARPSPPRGHSWPWVSVPWD